MKYACHECKKLLNEDHTINYEGYYICFDCYVKYKEKFVNRL